MALAHREHLRSFVMMCYTRPRIDDDIIY